MGYWKNPDKNIFLRTFGDFDATIELDDNSKWCASIQIAGWETPAIIGRYDDLTKAQNAINEHFRKLGIKGGATCDCCGKTIADEDMPSHLWLEIHGPKTWGSIQDSAVRYEWSQEGVYCLDCQERLLDAINDSILVPERYAYMKKDEQIVNEIKLIKSTLSKSNN